MLDDRTKALVRAYNPWWGGKSFQVPEYRRHVFPKVAKYLAAKQIIAIVGLRRVGKTVLMKQVIKDRLAEDGENVFYFLFDDLLTQNPTVLEDVLDYYLKTAAASGRKYIFLDEIQKVPFWQDILKRFYDTRDDIKFIVTGSASLQIKKSKESLAGRIFDVHMPVLSFREFLEMNGMRIEETSLDYSTLEKTYEENLHKTVEINNLFMEYLFKGAFPEIAGERDEEIIRSYVKNSVIEKIVFEDIPSVFAVRRKEVLYSIMEYACRNTSSILDVKKLAATLDINYRTARTHLFYLKNSFVLDLVYNHSKSAAKQLRKNKKVHVTHPALAMAMMAESKEALDSGETVSKYVETAAYQHCRINHEKISFLRTPQKEEIDIIIDESMTPIEVKYKSRIDADDKKSLLKFLDKHNTNKGFIITKDVFGREETNGKEIIMIPAWLFMITNY